MDSALSILLIGYGQMGRAFHDAWRRLPHPPILTIVDPVAPEADATDLAALPPQPWDVAFLAVKPQTMPDILPLLSRVVTGETRVISIAAGIPHATYQAALPGIPVIRAMPNTPAAIGRGVTAAFAPSGVDTLTESLLGAAGKVVVLDDEALFDAVTAVSGSGPAYVFHLVEALAEAARKAGLPDDLAATLARQTVIGAGALLDARPDISPAELRQSVTSPNGTTAAGLAVLMPDLTDIITRTVAAAARRSKELGQ